MNVPESNERTLIEMGSGAGPALGVEQILAELDKPVRGWDDSAPAIQMMFVELCDPVLEALSKDHGTIDSIPGYPVIQNLVRALNHVLAGFHLAQHGFLN